MCHVTNVELIKLKVLLDFLFYRHYSIKKYKIIDISQKWALTTLVLCSYTGCDKHRL